MCFALDMPCGASGIYLISKRSYIEWAQPIYRICASKYIDKSRTAMPSGSACQKSSVGAIIDRPWILLKQNPSPQGENKAKCLSALISKSEKRTMPQVCHSERSGSGVEESSHLWNMSSQIGAKILRLPPKICDFLRSLRMTDRCRVYSADYAELSR